MKRFTALVALAGLCSMAAAGPALGQDVNNSPPTNDGASQHYTPGQKVISYVAPSIVYEFVTWDAWAYSKSGGGYIRRTPFSFTTQCTGFVVNPDGYIATAGHCVDPKGDIVDFARNSIARWVRNGGGQFNYASWCSLRCIAQDIRLDGYANTAVGHMDRTVTVTWAVASSGIAAGKSMTAAVVKYQHFDNGDGALLKVDATDLSALLLAPTSDIQAGSNVDSVGYPAVVAESSDTTFDEPSFTAGSIGQITTIQGLYKVYQLSSQMAPGMSGGPTVDMDGQVIGFNSYTVGDTFGYARSSQIISDMLRDVGVDNELGAVNADYRRGLNAYYAGQKATAIAAFHAVLRRVPSHELAQKYLKLAEELKDPVHTTSDVAKSDGGFPVLPVGAGLLLVLGGGVGVMLFLKRRAGAGDPAGGDDDSPSGDEGGTLLTSDSWGAGGVDDDPDASEDSTDAALCPSCGVENDGSSRYCKWCGVQVA